MRPSCEWMSRLHSMCTCWIVHEIRRLDDVFEINERYLKHAQISFGSLGDLFVQRDSDSCTASFATGDVSVQQVSDSCAMSFVRWQGALRRAPSMRRRTPSAMSPLQQRRWSSASGGPHSSASRPAAGMFASLERAALSVHSFPGHPDNAACPPHVAASTPGFRSVIEVVAFCMGVRGIVASLWR